MTPERLVEIEVLADAATAGPWSSEWGEGSPFRYPMQGVRAVVLDSNRWQLATCWEEHNHGNDADDAAFIASARTDVPALCAALREAWDMIRVLRTDTDAYQRGRSDALAEAALEVQAVLSNWIALALPSDGRLGIRTVAEALRGMSEED